MSANSPNNCVFPFGVLRQMTFFLLDDPMKPDRFAQYAHIGTWTDGEICKECGVNSQWLTEPMQIEWDPGTETIGDFSWCGYTCVVTARVRRFLTQNDFACRFGRVEVMPPRYRTRMPRVPYPYTGPKLNWLRPVKRLSLNEGRSGVTMESDCWACGMRRYTFKREGLVIDAESWSGEKMFRISHFDRSAATFVTEDALKELTDQGFTNLCPLKAGIVDC